MLKILVTLFILIPFMSYSQDLIVLRNGEEIHCKIVSVDDDAVYYDFQQHGEKISSYIAKSDIRMYKTGAPENPVTKNHQSKSQQSSTTIVDTSEYKEVTSEWINLATFSMKYGLNAEGWSIQYYGYNLKNTSAWAIPVIFEFERMDIDKDYFSQFNYRSAEISYFTAGISPFYKASEVFYFNFGIMAIFGTEELTAFNSNESKNTFFGFAPSQGIYFIPKSDFGITMGVSAYEKITSSKVYKGDIGIKLEVGIKF